MSFWNTSDNKAVETNGNFEAGASMEPLPDGTSVIAAPVEAAWKTHEEEDYINIHWAVLAPEEYKNRRIFQKIKVYDQDTKKSDKAKRMLAAIDTNAGGKLIAIGREPNDAELTQNLVGKPMMLRLGLWEIEGKKGNWVQAVAPKNAQQQVAANTAQQPAQQSSTKPDLGAFDDVPF